MIINSIIGKYYFGSTAISANVFGLGDGGEIEAQKLSLAQMFNQGANIEISSKAPLLQNRCYVPFFIKDFKLLI